MISFLYFIMGTVILAFSIRDSIDYYETKKAKFAWYAVTGLLIAVFNLWAAQVL